MTESGCRTVTSLVVPKSFATCPPDSDISLLAHATGNGERPPFSSPYRLSELVRLGMRHDSRSSGPCRGGSDSGVCWVQEHDCTLLGHDNGAPGHRCGRGGYRPHQLGRQPRRILRTLPGGNRQGADWGPFDSPAHARWGIALHGPTGAHATGPGKTIFQRLMLINSCRRKSQSCSKSRIQKSRSETGAGHYQQPRSLPTSAERRSRRAGQAAAWFGRRGQLKLTARLRCHRRMRRSRASSTAGPIRPNRMITWSSAADFSPGRCKTPPLTCDPNAARPCTTRHPVPSSGAPQPSPVTVSH